MTTLQAALADRYTLDRELGRGGMATVYLAQDLKHHRPVALKVLRPRTRGALGPERFLQEIQQLPARLQHPHILTVLRLRRRRRLTLVHDAATSRVRACASGFGARCSCRWRGASRIAREVG